MEDEERRPLLDGQLDPRRSLREVLVGSAKPTELEKLLGGLALAVLCLAAVGWGLFAGEAYKLGEVQRGTDPEAPSRTSGPALPTSTSKPPIRNVRLRSFSAKAPESDHGRANRMRSA